MEYLLDISRLWETDPLKSFQQYNFLHMLWWWYVTFFIIHHVFYFKVVWLNSQRRHNHPAAKGVSNAVRLEDCGTHAEAQEQGAGYARTSWAAAKWTGNLQFHVLAYWSRLEWCSPEACGGLLKGEQIPWPSKWMEDCFPKTHLMCNNAPLNDGTNSRGYFFGSLKRNW